MDIKNLKCSKCSSTILMPMHHPLEGMGFSCWTCGKELWIQQSNMSSVPTRELHRNKIK